MALEEKLSANINVNTNIPCSQEFTKTKMLSSFSPKRLNKKTIFESFEIVIIVYAL